MGSLSRSASFGSVAQLVERSTENRKVTGSMPVGATGLSRSFYIAGSFSFSNSQTPRINPALSNHFLQLFLHHSSRPSVALERVHIDVLGHRRVLVIEERCDLCRCHTCSVKPGRRRLTECMR